MFDKEKAREEVKNLVDKYNKLIESGRLKSYNEEMTKKDFILPLFRALGWNVEDGEEVTAEERISKGRVDYAFRIDGIPKIFLEAKALKIDLEKAEFAEQSINYAWHKGSTWAVLTDFEGVKVFNAEWKSTNPLQNMFFSIDCHQFLDRFDQLLLLSREALGTGLIDKEAEKWGKKAKKIPVDKQLLNDLTRFREILTKNILKNNSSKNLSGDELDEAVQRILDRLIFIRTLEDRQLEAPVLQALIRENRHKRVYKKLNQLFRTIDEIYNSKLFQPHLCEELSIDDKVLERTISGLFKTSDSTVHYDFGAIDADVLGNIYEQYLGHILKKTAKRAKLTSEKAHRKEQGIYYTPTYVVNYIVKNTVGELAKNKKFDLENIKILDPACGSGSFLMKSFDYLITLSRKKNGDTEQTKLDLTGASATYGKKVEILKNNIFGVDLDPRAVEIAQLNLLLKAAEKKHRLPTLQENIKVGNSLIDDSDVAGNKSLKWQEEFEDIMNGGRFDVIIGNPPYVRPHNLNPKDKEFLWKNLKTFKAKSDLYNCFMEKGIDLLKEGGLFSFIVPHTWTSLESFYEIRKYILNNCKVVKLVQLPKKVFQDATVETCIFVLSKEKNEKVREKNKIIVERLDEGGQISPVKKFQQSRIKNNHLYNFELYSEESGNDLLNKIKNKGERLGNFIDFFYGLKTGDDEKFIFNTQQNEDYKKLLRSKDLGRYFKDFKGLYVWYVPNIMKKNKKTARPGDKERFESEKIIVARMGKQVVATYDNEEYYVKDGMLLLKKSENTNLKYITGVLNSKLINYYYKNYFITIDVLKNALLELPIAKADKVMVSKSSDFVDRLESLNKGLIKLKGKTTDEKLRLEKEIKKLSEQMDHEVYKIYGLTKDEIKIIEESMK